MLHVVCVPRVHRDLEPGVPVGSGEEEEGVGRRGGGRAQHDELDCVPRTKREHCSQHRGRRWGRLK